MAEQKHAVSPDGKSTRLSSLGHFGTSQGDGLPLDRSSIDRLTVAKGYEQFKQQIHLKLVTLLNFEEVLKLSEESRQSEIRNVLQRLIEDEKGTMPGAIDRERLIQDLLNDALGLGPLEELLRDPTISAILINGAQEVFIERRGKLYASEVKFKDDDHLLQIIDRIVSRIGRRVDETSPMVDARLKDGSRVNVILPPLALKGPTMCIRRFGTAPLRMKDLVSKN